MSIAAPTIVQGLFIEALLTAYLCFTVLMLSTENPDARTSAPVSLHPTQILNSSLSSDSHLFLLNLLRRVSLAVASIPLALSVHSSSNNNSMDMIGFTSLGIYLPVRIDIDRSSDRRLPPCFTGASSLSSMIRIGRCCISGCAVTRVQWRSSLTGKTRSVGRKSGVKVYKGDTR